MPVPVSVGDDWTLRSDVLQTLRDGVQAVYAAVVASGFPPVWTLVAVPSLGGDVAHVHLWSGIVGSYPSQIYGLQAALFHPPDGLAYQFVNPATSTYWTLPQLRA